MARVCFKTNQTTTTTTKGTKGLAGSSTCCPAWGSESNPWNTQKARGPDAVMNICKPSAPVAERGRDRGNAWKLQGQAAWNPKGHNGNRQRQMKEPLIRTCMLWCTHITHTEWCTHIIHTMVHTHHTHNGAYTSHTRNGTHTSHTMVQTHHTHKTT